MTARRRLAWRMALGPCALLLASPLRHRLEAGMALHMLVEFPLLLLAGAATASLVRRQALADLAWDAGGVTSAVVVVATFSIWMIPSQLDASLLDGRFAAAKYASWWLAGIALARGRSIWRREVAGFVLGNIAWMTATVGLLYQDLPQRLCVNYTFDSQLRAGEGLVLAAALIGAAAVRWCVPGVSAPRPSSAPRPPRPPAAPTATPRRP